MFGVAENLEIVRHPDKVDACVLRYFPPPNGKRENHERYEDTAFIEVSAKSVAAIRDVLLADSTYIWDRVTICWPRYHTRMRFHRAGKVVAVDFCLDCSLVQVLRDGRFVGNGLFHKRFPGLLAELRQIFPNDNTLAKVK